MARSQAHKAISAPSDDEPVQDIVPAPQPLLVPISLMLAAESVCSTEETRHYLNGVHLHIVDGRGRAVGTDGHRVFVGSFGFDEANPPAWGASGITIHYEHLRARLSMISKFSGDLVRIEYAENAARVELSDRAGEMLFRHKLCDGNFPAYERVIPADAFASLDDDGMAKRRAEWEPIGINSRYLKQIGDVAKTLEGGLQKDARTKTGMVVRAYNSGDNGSPLVFDFSLVPGAILVLAAAKVANAIAGETAKLLDGPVKATLAALRAHATRNRGWEATATDPAEQQRFRDAAAGFDKRIAAIMEKVPGLTAIAAPETPVEPEPEADAAPVAPEPDAPATGDDEGDAEVVEPETEQPAAELMTVPDPEQAEIETAEVDATLPKKARRATRKPRLH